MASPQRLKATIRTTRVSPGQITSHASNVMKLRDAESIDPKSGWGGRAPNPRKLRVAYASWAVDMLSAVRTIRGARMLGMMWRATIRGALIEAIRAASTYAVPSTVSVETRATLANRGT